MTLTLPYPPLLNKYYGHKVMKVRGKYVPNVYVTPEGKAYKLNVKLLARSRGVAEIKGPVAVSIDVYRPQKRGDIDGVLKCLLDALNGVLYEDDSQIIELHVARLDDPEKPRVQINAWGMPL